MTTWSKETVESGARAMHDWNCGHLPPDERDAHWIRDKHQLLSKSRAFLSAIEQGKEVRDLVEAAKLVAHMEDMTTPEEYEALELALQPFIGEDSDV